MRDAALAVIREIGVETGGSNIQFAVNPENGRMIVIEMNPRVSRSSRWRRRRPASRSRRSPPSWPSATRWTRSRTTSRARRRPAFEPTIDYVVVKMPRFAFEKFPGADDELGPQMKSVGEVMAIGRTFREAWARRCARWRSAAGAWTSTRRPPLDDLQARSIVRAQPRSAVAARARRCAPACREAEAPPAHQDRSLVPAPAAADGRRGRGGAHRRRDARRRRARGRPRRCCGASSWACPTAASPKLTGTSEEQVRRRA